MFRFCVCIALLVAGCSLCSEAAKPKGGPHSPRNFHKMYGWDCVQHPYVWNFRHVRSVSLCARICNSVRDCQAFSLERGHCRLFVFNKCSKDVRSCSCNQGTLLYVKRQWGLPPGALCPADFSYNRCGVKFKFTRPASGRWDAVMASCTAEPGLSIMAETIDRARHFYLMSLHDRWIRRPGEIGHYFLGASQDPGSPEPAGGWFWQSCRIPFDPSLWQKDEPNNFNGEHHAGRHIGMPLMNDFPMSFPGLKGGFCECVSPFDLN